MSLRRVTEDEILEYLDGTMSPAELHEFELRLNVYPEDRELLEEYRSLFGHLSHRGSYSENLLATLPSKPVERRAPRWMPGAMTVAVSLASVFVILAVANLIEFKPVQAFFGLMADATLQIVFQIVDPVTKLLMEFNVSLAIVIAAAVILTGFKSLDVIFVEAKYRRLMR